MNYCAYLTVIFILSPTVRLPVADSTSLFNKEVIKNSLSNYNPENLLLNLREGDNNDPITFFIKFLLIWGLTKNAKPT